MRVRGEVPVGVGLWRGEGVARDANSPTQRFNHPAFSPDGVSVGVVTSRGTLLSRLSPGVASGRGDASPFLTPKYEKVAKIFDRQYHSPSKVLKLEDDPWGSCAMYSPEKMKSGGGLMAPPGCFPGRYSPTYRTTDPRRCVPNPSVSPSFL
ncbi:unnamed protein product [Leptosia nina]|uniref:Uncharacterized protein n=1 Tax=Leptosia nina TaxID=320188 RepID=A0AAV1K1D7_9NEOP